MHDRTRTTRLSARALTAALAVAAGTSGALADSVSLRPAIRVPHAASVTLADLASLDGPDAVRLASLEIAVADAGAFEISAERVRQAIVAAGGDPRAIRVRGDSTVVRPLRGRAADLAERTSPATVAAPSTGGLAVGSDDQPRIVDPNTCLSTATPLGLVAANLVGAFGDDARDLRIELDDRDLAALAGQPGVRYEIAPRSALRSDRAEFEVVARRPLATGGSEVLSRERVRIELRLERAVPVASCDARRGETLSPAHVRVETRLVTPTLAARAAEAGIEGAVLARTVTEGSVIESTDLERSLAIRRNDRVLLRREIGSVAIEIEAVALEDGSTGDLVAFETGRGSRRRDARPVIAEIVGKGRAVIR